LHFSTEDFCTRHLWIKSFKYSSATSSKVLLSLLCCSISPPHLWRKTQFARRKDIQPDKPIRMNERTTMKASAENVMHEEWEHRGNGCVTLPYENAKFVRVRCYDCLQIAFKIKNIKSDLGENKSQIQ
jgi:hypothetical protein